MSSILRNYFIIATRRVHLFRSIKRNTPASILWIVRVNMSGGGGGGGDGKPRPYFISAISGMSKTSPTINGQQRPSRSGSGMFGEDAYFCTSTRTADVLGVADGVGGWRQHGVDPGEFSSSLMQRCRHNVHQSGFNPRKPVHLIAESFNEMTKSKNPPVGSSTVCVLSLSRPNRMLYAANLGDSGFMVLRRKKIVFKSTEQQHGFNTPYQLSMAPADYADMSVSDNPYAADCYEIKLLDQDVVVLATDGVFDNVPGDMLARVVGRIQGGIGQAPAHLTRTANDITRLARLMSFDEDFMSPYAKNAQRYCMNIKGGKPDDMTVIVAQVHF